jgi:DNA-binding MarR family transcriptional regulator
VPGVAQRSLWSEPDPELTNEAHPHQQELASAWADFLAAMREARQPSRSSNGLSLAQFRLLSPLAENTSLRVGELADRAEIRGPTASRMLDGLQRQGLVRRTHSRDDRRHVRVSLTPAGRQCVTDKQGQIERARSDAFAQLSDEEQAHAARFLGLMADVIRHL